MKRNKHLLVQWEYQIINDWEHGNPDSEEGLNELGKEGWELVSVVDHIVKVISSGPLTGKRWYFKRRLQNGPH